MSVDLGKGPLGIPAIIWKTPKITKCHMFLHYHESVSITWCYQSSTCFLLYLKFYISDIVMATIMP